MSLTNVHIFCASVVPHLNMNLLFLCYGQLSPEEVTRNAGYYFDTNRLNVSLTRARRKRILLLSAAMLRPEGVPADDTGAADAFFYLQDSVQAIRESPACGEVMTGIRLFQQYGRMLCFLFLL